MPTAESNDSYEGKAGLCPDPPGAEPLDLNLLEINGFQRPSAFGGSRAKPWSGGQGGEAPLKLATFGELQRIFLHESLCFGKILGKYLLGIYINTLRTRNKIVIASASTT